MVKNSTYQDFTFFSAKKAPAKAKQIAELREIVLRTGQAIEVKKLPPGYAYGIAPTTMESSHGAFRQLEYKNRGD